MGASRGRLAPARRLRERRQPGDVGHRHTPSSTLDEPLLLPRGECPTHGVQGRSGHIRDVLPRKGEWHLDQIADSTAETSCQSNQGVGDPLFHRLVGKLPNPSLHVTQAPFALANGIQRGAGLL
ncbi:MAG: hypothetical protein K0S03_2501, partial [Burkholderiales bacterium]|nr:hypothetical protein [Burkholderiales bacterium]